MLKHKDSYTMRQFDPKVDKEALISLWQRNLQDVTYRRFEWIYNKGIDRVKTWVLLKKGKMCGAISLLIQESEYTLERIKIGFLFDFMVDKRDRTIFPALKLLRYAISEVKKTEIDFLLAMPNKNASVVFSKALFDHYNTAERWVSVVDFYNKLSFIPDFKYGELLRLSISRLLNYAKEIATDIAFHGNKKNIQFVNCSSNDLSIMGKETKDINVNFSSFINWRYCHNPVKKFYFFSIKVFAKSVMIIYHIKDSEAIIEKIIADYDGNKYIGLTLHCLTDHLRDQNIQTISLVLMGRDSWHRQLWQSGFVRRKSEGRVYIMDLQRKGISLNENCVLFEGDMDL